MVNKFFKNTSILLILMIVSKVCGLLREIVLAHFYGASYISDAFVIVTATYTMLFSALSSSITVSYIQHTSKNSENQNSITTKLVMIVSLVVFAVSTIICIFPDIFVQLFAIGFDTRTIDVTVNMLYVFLPFCFLLSARYILSSFLQTKGIFWVMGSNNVITGVLVVLAIIFSNSNYLILPLGETIGIVLSFIFTLIFVKKKGFKFDKVKLFDFKPLKPIFLMMIPLFLGQLIQQFNVIVDKNFASMVGEGVISSINYANKVNILFSTFFVASLTTVLFPILSKHSGENKEKFNEIVKKSSKVIMMIAIPITIGIILLSEEIVTLLYMRGAFSYDDVKVTSEILMIYAIGIPALSMTDLLNKQFYAMGNSKTPVILSVGSLAINIILNFIWVENLGYIGLAISTTISVTILAISLMIKFAKDYGLNILKDNSRGFINIVISAVVMTLIVVISMMMTVNQTDIIILLVAVSLAVISYISIMFVLKDSDMMYIKNKILKKKN